MSLPRFTGTSTYVATEDLALAVNASVALGRPLLIKGEPGTGKTVLAREIARFLDAPFLSWEIKSTTKAQQGLYEYDAVARLRDSQLGYEGANAISNYIKRGRIWEAFNAEERPVLLIDEIDKADVEFPNDLLHELDQMSFFVPETRETIRAKHRPIVIITSNNERTLPAPFLRRCFFHFIRFPDRTTMQRILAVHFPDLEAELMRAALNLFFQIRAVGTLAKPPSTSELIDWVRLLRLEGVTPGQLDAGGRGRAHVPMQGALLKSEDDLDELSRCHPLDAVAAV
ncbi:MAG: MoxR family ATPase [Rhodospirillaceae bacterium]|nr:MoxR family ATPase [Rhodospirillaceae bacterium]